MKKFLEGLGMAAIGGAFAGSAAYLSDPSSISGPALGKRVGIVASVGAITAIAAWLKQSPIKPQ